MKENKKEKKRGALAVVLAVCMIFSLMPIQQAHATTEPKFTTFEPQTSDVTFDNPNGLVLDSQGNMYVLDSSKGILKRENSGKWLQFGGGIGVEDGQFSGHKGISIDSSGNMYVAEAGNDRIQKFDSSGNFLVKWGSFGSEDGQFKALSGVSTDSSGNVYVTEGKGSRIQKFDSNGNFLAKWGSFGSEDGQFWGPNGVTIDSSGNVYVADTSNHRIQKFDSSGTFLAKWGSEGSGDGQFSYPRGISIDSSGNVYVADSLNNRIQKFDSSGTFLAKWGSVGSGDGQFSSPDGVSIDSSGNVYVADTNNNRIQKFDSSGNFVEKWGSDIEDEQFRALGGVSIDSSGNVYVTDAEKHRIQKFDSSGKLLTKWGSEGSEDGQFNYPYGNTIDSSGNVYVADTSNNRIQKFDSNGDFLAKWGSEGSEDGQFYKPSGVSIDSSGNVYVADTWNHRIQKFTSNGAFLAKWGSEGSEDGQFIYPSGVSIDSSGNVYVANTDNNQIQKFDSSGAFIAKWGSFGSGDGQFNSPSGVSIDSSGNVYVADTGNNRIQKFDSNGAFLATWGSVGSGDGQFGYPRELCIDSSGNVYVADTGNNRIVKMDFSEGATLVDKISLFPADGATSLLTGTTLKINNLVSPFDATNKQLNWSISNEGGAEASVDANGVINVGVNPGNTTVRATAQDGSDIYAEVTFGIEAPVPPSEVRNLAAQTIGDSVKLSWNPPENEGSRPIVRFEIFHKQSADSEYIASSETTRWSHTIENLTPGVPYTFKVVAISSVAEGAEAFCTATPTEAEIKQIKLYIPKTVTGGSVQITMVDGSAVPDNFTTLPQDEVIKLYAKPNKGKKFIRWSSTAYNPVGGSLEELSIMENNLDNFSFEEFEGYNTTNPLMVKVMNAASYIAEFGDLENMDEQGNLLATASALQMLSVVPLTEQDRPIILMGENGIQDYQNGIFKYDLNLVSTDDNNLRFNLAVATGSSVSIGGVALELTPAALVEGEPEAITLEGHKDIEVTSGVAVTISVQNPDKSETTYTIMPKISEEVSADPKVILELQTLEGQAQAELAMIIKNAFFNQAQFTISIDEIPSATESGLKYFTNADGEKLVGDAEGVLSPAETANYNSLFKGVEIFHMAVANDARELTFTIVPKASPDENGLMVVRPISINDAGGGELMARFYIKQDGSESLEDMKNQLQVDKDMNTMTDGNLGELVNDGLNQESTSLVFTKLADMYWFSGYVSTNSKKLTLNGTTSVRASNGAIKVDVYDTIKNKHITDKEESKIAITNDGVLNYRVFKSSYRFSILTPGYMRYDTPDYVVTDKNTNLPIINLLAGDINADGFINTEDRAAMLSVYNKEAVNGAVNTTPADFDDSGRVDGNDLGLLLSNYGRKTTREGL